MPETRSFPNQCVMCLSAPPTITQGWKCVVWKTVAVPPSLTLGSLLRGLLSRTAAAAVWGKLLKYWGRQGGQHSPHLHLTLSAPGLGRTQGSSTAYGPVLVHGLPQPSLLPPRLPRHTFHGSPCPLHPPGGTLWHGEEDVGPRGMHRNRCQPV